MTTTTDVDILDAPIEGLGLSQAVYNILCRYARWDHMAGKTVGQLVEFSPTDLRTMRGMGPKHIREIETALAECGLALHAERPKPSYGSRLDQLRASLRLKGGASVSHPASRVPLLRVTLRLTEPQAMLLMRLLEALRKNPPAGVNWVDQRLVHTLCEDLSLALGDFERDRDSIDLQDLAGGQSIRSVFGDNDDDGDPVGAIV